MRATVVDRLVALLDAYAQGRAAEKAIGRSMRSYKCAFGQGVRCYLPASGKPDGECCEPCETRRAIWRTFAAARRANKALLRRIELLGLRLSMPDQVEPEESKPLLEMMGVTDGRT